MYMYYIDCIGSKNKCNMSANYIHVYTCIHMYIYNVLYVRVHCEREAWTCPDVIYVQVPVKASLGKLCLVASLWALFPCPELLSTGHPSGGLVWVHAFLQ